jgi:tetratricopeptide (TPR) repeat protein
LLNQLGRHEEALKVYDTLIKKEPDYAVAHSNRGNVLSLLQRFEEAINSYNKAIELSPRTSSYIADVYIGKEEALINIDNLPEALESFKIIQIQQVPIMIKVSHYRN